MTTQPISPLHSSLSRRSLLCGLVSGAAALTLVLIVMVLNLIARRIASRNRLT